MEQVEKLLEIITKARKEKKLTQQQLADKLGIVRKTYASYEANTSQITLEIFFRVLAILEIDVKDLFHTQPNISKEDIDDLFNKVNNLKDKFEKSI